MPVPVHAPRLFVKSCRNEAEQRFLHRLNDRAAQGNWYADSWSHLADHVIISVVSMDGNVVRRTLRADFLGTRLLLGDDETHQFATELDPTSSGVVEYRDGSPELFADATADWFEKELSLGRFSRSIG